MKKAVVLLSGGIDSTTTMAIADSDGYGIYALSFNYGQRHNVELEFARKNTELFRVKKHLIVDFNLREMGGSALTSDIEVPKDRTQNTEERTHTEDNDIPITYVPARNTIFLSFALAWAETLGAGVIFIGANAVDYSGYPDCRPEYIQAFEDMANLATKVSVEGNIRFNIQAPLIQLSKADIIRRGMQLGVDYSLTWSCYDPQKGHATDVPEDVPDYRPCLRCDSCRIRAKGFREAGVEDPQTGS